jgi:hypothetical protein
MERPDGHLWLDVPDWNDQAARLLSRTFGFHPVALEFCRTRTCLPMVRGYAEHVFLAMHRPLLVPSGHAQLIELDLFVGDRFLSACTAWWVRRCRRRRRWTRCARRSIGCGPGGSGRSLRPPWAGRCWPGPAGCCPGHRGPPGAGPRPGGQTHVTQLVLILVLLLMATISSILLRLTKKQGWW